MASGFKHICILTRAAHQVFWAKFLEGNLTDIELVEYAQYD